jgi:hypothetical protein
MVDAETTTAAATGQSGRLTDRQKHILIGSGVVFFISLGVLIPALGLFIGWVFTLGGGFAGGATVAYLRGGGGRNGAKYGLIVALLGGVPSSIVGVIGGTILNAAVLSSQQGGSDSGAGLLVFAIVGLISGMFLKLFGGVVGGGLVGWFFDSDAHN